MDSGDRKQTLYLETSVVSYLTGRASRDVVTLARKEITREWWERDIAKYHVLISETVLAEASEGDKEAAKKRLSMLEVLGGKAH